MQGRRANRDEMLKFIAERRDELYRLQFESQSGPNVLVRIGARMQLQAVIKLVAKLEAVIQAEDAEDARLRNPEGMSGPWT